MYDGQPIIVNTGGPDILATLDSRRPYVEALAREKCVLARFGPGSAQWLQPAHVRPALLDDLRQVSGMTFAAWQLALWRALLASGQAPFDASAREALRPYWLDGRSVAWMIGEIAHVRQQRTGTES